MGRQRTKEYLDIPLKATEIIKLRKGYKINKLIKQQPISLYIDGKDRKKEREIARLKEKIKKLEGKKK